MYEVIKKADEFGLNKVFVNSRDFVNVIEDDSTVFEQKPLQKLSHDNELMAFKHEGFWQCMDTQRDKSLLEDMWLKGKAPWKVW